MKRGRKTIADLVVLIPGGKQLPPPPLPTLSVEQAQVWVDTLAAVPPDWLSPAHYPLMAAYCRHVCRAQSLEAEIAGFRSEWLLVAGGPERLNKFLLMAERETRAAFGCARQLRLTPASVVHKKTAGTALGNFRPGIVPWDKKTR